MPLVSSVDSVPFEPARGSTPGGVCDSTVAGCSKAVDGTSGTPGASLSATFASTELLIAAPHAPTSNAIGINAPAFCQRLSRCALIAGPSPFAPPATPPAAVQMSQSRESTTCTSTLHLMCGSHHLSHGLYVVQRRTCRRVT